VTASEDLEAVNTEVEGSTVLKAVTRQRLVKTEQTEKTQYMLSELLSVCVSDSAIITYSYDLQASNNDNINGGS
jgi:hypothetical protein